MKVINYIDSKFFLCIDVETVPIEDNYEDLSEDYQLAWSYKMKNDGTVPNDADIAEMWKQKSSLYAEFSTICAISVAYIHNKNNKERAVCREFKIDKTHENVEERELKLLVEFALALNKIYDKEPKYRLAAHSGKYFDYPVLCKRLLINGIQLPRMLDYTDVPPYKNPNIDTNWDIWKCGYTGPGSSLIALCVALGIPISKGDMFGSDVREAFKEGKFDEISRYCSKDAISVLNIIRKLKNEKIFQFDDVKYL